MFYKIDFLVLKFKSLLLKPKLNLLNQIYILKNLQDAIKMALHKYVC
jgi:hypothetical protein